MKDATRRIFHRIHRNYKAARDDAVWNGESKSGTTAFMVRFLRDRLELRGGTKVSIERKDTLVFRRTSHHERLLNDLRKLCSWRTDAFRYCMFYLTHKAMKERQSAQKNSKMPSLHDKFRRTNKITCRSRRKITCEAWHTFKDLGECRRRRPIQDLHNVINLLKIQHFERSHLHVKPK